MQFVSTNGRAPSASLREAIFKGLPDDGGLYVPAVIPRMPAKFIESVGKLTLQEISFAIASRFIEDEIPASALRNIVEEAINFDAPLRKLSADVFVLELFHGPTLAFKDFGARFMARVLSYFRETDSREITILAATSGDTGSAVANGFSEIPGMRVMLLYPAGQITEIQEKQMTTQGGNVCALKVAGNFDDCQSLVKQAFVDQELNQKLCLTSANSINLARLIPQTFYYWYAYGQSRAGEVIFSVPSGNYGNLTAGLWAKKMGLPALRFIAATNRNDTVPKFLETGIFQPKPSVSTLSNSMDVGNPSNFARILHLYELNVDAMRADLSGASFSDPETKDGMKELFARYKYIAEPHGAIGYLGLKLFQRTGQAGISLETAHPAKFWDIVEDVIGVRVDLPEQIRSVMNRRENSIRISSNFSDLKAFLLSSDL